jgi:ABC-type transport system substrate-binding protein
MPRAARDRLAQRYGVNRQQFFRRFGFYTDGLVLNTSRPLFHGNAALRRAVNLAIDRAAILRAGGSSRWTKATDQILPSNLPGWTDYHLYRLAHPALARARSLARGHLRGGRAVLYTCAGKLPFAISTCDGLPEEAAVIVHDLKAIGIDARVKVFDVNVLSARAGPRGAPYDMLLAGFGFGYVDPGSMIVPLLAGENAEKPSGNSNLAYFDVPRFNREIAAADRLAGAPRYRAFSRLDAQIMREAAPWAPLYEGSATLLVSKRVGCLKVQPALIRDYAAMCLR